MNHLQNSRQLELVNTFEDIIEAAISSGINYIEDNPAISVLVLGVSGGIDSAVTAVLARKVCDSLKDVKLLGYALNIDGNKDDEMQRAVEVGEAYCDEFNVIDLNKAFLSLTKDIDESLYYKHISDMPKCTYTDRVRAGNIKARIRMAYLYNKASAHRGIVLSTDNLTEYNLGFWTLHGDVGDFGFMQELWKTEVYGIGELIGGPVMGCVNANPTDGLGITNSDIDQLLPGWTAADGSYRDAYRIVDEILIGYLSRKGNYDLDHPVILRHESTQFKRNNPVNVSRERLLWKQSCHPFEYIPF